MSQGTTGLHVLSQMLTLWLHQISEEARVCDLIEDLNYQDKIGVLLTNRGMWLWNG